MLSNLHEIVPVKRNKRKAEHERHSSSAPKKNIPPRRELEVYFGQACSLRQQAPAFCGDGRATQATSGSATHREATNSSSARFQSYFPPSPETAEMFSLLVGEEATDDESEFSSLDGRTSPSQPGSWRYGVTHDQPPFGFGVGVEDLYRAAGSTGFARTQAGAVGYPAEHHGGVLQTPIGSNGPMVGDGICSGNNNDGSSIYRAAPYDRQQQQQQQQYEYCLNNQQHLQQQQQPQQLQRNGSRPDADEWGWFVDAGEDLPSRASQSHSQRGGSQD